MTLSFCFRQFYPGPLNFNFCMTYFIQNVKNFTDEDIEAYKYALSQSGVSGPLNYYRNAMMSNDLPKGYSRTKIKAPTLVVWVSVFS